MSKPGVEFSVHVSYIEIYKEELRDLIDNTMTAREILIREDEEGHTGTWKNWRWEWLGDEARLFPFFIPLPKQTG